MTSPSFFTCFGGQIPIVPKPELRATVGGIPLLYKPPFGVTNRRVGRYNLPRCLILVLRKFGQKGAGFPHTSHQLKILTKSDKKWPPSFRQFLEEKCIDQQTPVEKHGETMRANS